MNLEEEEDLNKNKNYNNNLDSDKWGPKAWETLHSITFGYPNNPTPEQQKKYKMFFTLLKDVLPCCSCRENFENHLRMPSLELNDKRLQNKDSLTRWLFEMHNHVNVSLGKKLEEYENVKIKYESMRVKNGGGEASLHKPKYYLYKPNKKN
jgi:hypothetical protein